jgi:hypothetical protein
MAAQICIHATGSCFPAPFIGAKTSVPFIGTKTSNDGEGGGAYQLRCERRKGVRENLLSPSRLEIKKTQLSSPAVLDGWPHEATDAGS